MKTYRNTKKNRIVGYVEGIGSLISVILIFTMPYLIFVILPCMAIFYFLIYISKEK